MLLGASTSCIIVYYFVGDDRLMIMMTLKLDWLLSVSIMGILIIISCTTCV